MVEIVLVFEDVHGFNTPSIVEIDFIQEDVKWVVHDVLIFGDNKNKVVLTKHYGCNDCQGYGCNRCRAYKEIEIDESCIKSPLYKYGFIRE